jgi:hypothetical protein
MGCVGLAGFTWMWSVVGREALMMFNGFYTLVLIFG